MTVRLGDTIIICAVCGYPGEEGTRVTSAGWELERVHGVRVCLRCHVHTFDLLRWVERDCWSRDGDHQRLPLSLLHHMTAREPPAPTSPTDKGD